MSEGQGWPDFLCFKRINNERNIYEVIGVESKFGKYLDAEEKQKAAWLLKHNVFEKILVAYKGKKRGVIEYEQF
jgi:hypothetical protein